MYHQWILKTAHLLTKVVTPPGATTEQSAEIHNQVAHRKSYIIGTIVATIGYGTSTEEVILKELDEIMNEAVALNWAFDLQANTTMEWSFGYEALAARAFEIEMERMEWDGKPEGQLGKGKVVKVVIQPALIKRVTGDGMDYDVEKVLAMGVAMCDG